MQIVRPTILVAEDNKVNQMAMEALLENIGYGCELVDDGSQAVEAAKQKHYDLILMDVSMPVMDGYEATKEIRENEFGTGKHVPIVTMTALGEEVKDKCIEAGMDDFLEKPVDVHTLIEKLQLWISTQPERDTSVPLQSAADLEDLSAKVLLALYGSANKKVLQAFLDVTTRLLDELENAIRMHDSELIKRAVHELKGATLQVRARDMAQLCAQLESASKHNDASQMVALYATLSHAFVRVKELLEAGAAPARN